jgi:hypothetical protein
MARFWGQKKHIEKTLIDEAMAYLHKNWLELTCSREYFVLQSLLLTASYGGNVSGWGAGSSGSDEVSSDWGEASSDWGEASSGRGVELFCLFPFFFSKTVSVDGGACSDFAGVAFSPLVRCTMDQNVKQLRVETSIKTFHQYQG